MLRKAPALVAIKYADKPAGRSLVGDARAKLQALIDGLVRENEFNEARSRAEEASTAPA